MKANKREKSLHRKANRHGTNKKKVQRAHRKRHKEVSQSALDRDGWRAAVNQS
jgi:hypothetical protein